MALAAMTKDAGHQVTLWSYRKDEADLLRETRINEKLLPGLTLDPAISVRSDLEGIGDAEMVLIATPSKAVRETSRRIAPCLSSGTVVICVSKGLEPDTSKTVSQVMKEELPGFDCVVLSGPSHAEEVSKGIPTTVVVASPNRAAAELVQEKLSNPFFRIYVNDDVTGVELGGATKNVIALAAGVLDGLGLGDNSKAALMTRGMVEMARLGVACGAKAATFSGLSGMGDLIVTCTSKHSRNRRAGMLIGAGKTVAEALEEVGMTVEGVTCTKAVYELSRRMGVEMPITNELYRILYENEPPKGAIASLMGRPSKSESESLWAQTSE